MDFLKKNLVLKKKIKLSIQDLELKNDWFDLNFRLIFNWDVTCRNFEFSDFVLVPSYSFKNFNFILATNDVRNNSDLNLVKSYLFLKQLFNLNFSEKLNVLLRSPFIKNKMKSGLNNSQFEKRKSSQAISSSDNTYYFYSKIFQYSKIKFIKFYFTVLIPYFLKRQIQFRFSFSRVKQSFNFFLLDVPQLLTNNFFYLQYDYFEWNRTNFIFTAERFFNKKQNSNRQFNSEVDDFFKPLCYNSFFRLN